MRTRGEFRIRETPGRLQPFAVIREGFIWRFCATKTEAEAYVAAQYRAWREQR